MGHRLTLGEKVLGGFAGVLLLSVVILGWRLTASHNRERRAGLSADSLAAALDTSRVVLLSRRDSIRILGDSISAVGRRSFQVAQRNDALDRAQGLDRVAIANLEAAVRALSIKVGSSAPVAVDSQGTRTATFAIDSTPYHGTAAVSLPAAGAGSIDLRLRIDTARLGVRLGCGEKGEGGIRSASATLTGPPWLGMALGRVEQAPEVCNPTPAKRNLLARLLSKCGVGAGGSLALVSGSIEARPAVIAGCLVWP